MDLADEVIDRARRFGSRDEQQRGYLRSLVRKQTAEVAVPALLSVFSRSTEAKVAFEEQELAGYLLWNCSHGCSIPPKDVILAVLDTWDLSVEELPWYLCREFGSNTVMNCIRELLAIPQEERRRRALDTLAYWTVGYDRMRRDDP